VEVCFCSEERGLEGPQRAAMFVAGERIVWGCVVVMKTKLVKREGTLVPRQG